MQKDAMSRIPEEGPEYRILVTRDDQGPFTGRYIFGQYRVPLYLNQTSPGAKLVFGEEGLPEFQGFTWAPFSITIPTSLTRGEQEPQGTVQFGHGLFQNHLVVLTEELQEASSRGGVLLYSTNMVGMSARDVPEIAAMLNRDLSDASILPHGCLQGVLNHLILTELLESPRLAEDPRFFFNNRTVLDPSAHSYLGYSMGGIYGPTQISVNPRIHQGVFGVPGSPYVLLLPRASPFRGYWQIITSRYSNPIDRIMLLSLLQIIWDHVDSVGWVDLLGENPEKRGQFVWAKGDAQVTYLGNDVLARGANARVFSNLVFARDNETLFGLEVLEEKQTDRGHISIGYDFGVPEVPIYNVPPNKDYDTHNEVYAQQSFVLRSLSLFAEKVHYQQCDGPCGYDP